MSRQWVCLEAMTWRWWPRLTMRDWHGQLRPAMCSLDKTKKRNGKHWKSSLYWRQAYSGWGICTEWLVWFLKMVKQKLEDVRGPGSTYRQSIDLQNIAIRGNMDRNRQRPVTVETILPNGKWKNWDPIQTWSCVKFSKPNPVINIQSS